MLASTVAFEAIRFCWGIHYRIVFPAYCTGDNQNSKEIRVTPRGMIAKTTLRIQPMGLFTDCVAATTRRQ
jgi:hypothetical protein